VDDSGPEPFRLEFFRFVRAACKAVLKAAFAACFFVNVGSSLPAETGDVMIAIDQMKAETPPAGFTFARTGRGGDSVTRFDRIKITTLPHGGD
jgi:hypothetical protein